MLHVILSMSNGAARASNSELVLICNKQPKVITGRPHRIPFPPRRHGEVGTPSNKPTMFLGYASVSTPKSKQDRRYVLPFSLFAGRRRVTD